MKTVTDAHNALVRADREIAKATAARDHARYQLDQALAEVGWTRLRGVFNPDATPLYQNAVYPDAGLDLPAVLRHLEHQRKAAA